MTYVKNIWVNQEVERPKTYEMSNNSDGSVTLIDSFGLVSEIGTPVNADNMNHIEEGIAACDLRKYDPLETYATDEWVTGLVNGNKNIYKSLIDDNIGNPLIDENAWEMVKLGGGSGTSLPLFTPVIIDHYLSYEEHRGLGLQGTYVYSTAIAGTRYGYPDFVNKCIEEKNAGIATTVTLGSSTLTMYINANGHQFYDIADKAIVDTFFNTFGVADFYGVDEVNSRVFLPRNNYFMQLTTNLADVNKFTEAGLPAITHTHTRGSMNITGTYQAHQFAEQGSGTGAFYNINSTYQNPGGGNGNSSGIGFEAARNWTGSTSNNSAVNAIYGRCNTVQPPSSKKLLYYVVGNTVSDTSWIDVVTQVEGGVKDIQDATDEGIERLKASSNAITTTSISNCITEIPQRIKYTLENGVLTILAGSVVIVPYGTDAPTKAIGDNFPTADYKIVDIQYSNNQLFYWVELLVNKELETINATHECYVCLIIEDTDDNEEIPGDITAYYVSAGSSSATNDGGGLHYNTASNLVDFGGTDIYSLPLMIVDYNSNKELISVVSTFNGIGFIGSTIFVDKGVKGLMTNQKNPDGTFNSISYETPELLVWNQQIPVSTNHEIILKNDGTFARCPEYVVKPNGYLAQEDKLEDITAFSIGYISTNDKSIISMKPKQVFQAADVQDIDGAWVGVNKILVNNQTYPTSKDTVIDLSDILPKDDNIYECLFEANAITGATSGNYLNVIIKSSALNNGISIISCRTRTNSTMQCNGNVLYPIGRDKKLTVVNNSSYVGNYSLFIKGYRKVR